MGILDGMVAVVTGAGRGIGREHALLCASEGAKVVVNDLGGGTDGTGAAGGPAQEVADEIVAAGGEAVADGSDVADAAGAQAIIDTAVESFGDVNVVINNAGILRDKVLIKMEDDDWDVVVRVNLRGSMLTSRAAARHWRERSKKGVEAPAAIVNTSSESGAFGNVGQANYAAAKAAVASLTQVSAKELTRYGVRVNAILPRARTRLTEDLMPPPKGEGEFDRWEPANVSPFVIYLASPDCGFSGEIFLVGGGLVQYVRPYELDPSWRIKHDGPWAPSEIAAAVADAGDVPNERDTGYIK